MKRKLYKLLQHGPETVRSRRRCSATRPLLASLLLLVSLGICPAANARVAGYVPARLHGITYNVPLSYHPKAGDNDLFIRAQLPNMASLSGQENPPWLGWGNRVNILIHDASSTTTVQYRLSVQDKIYGAMTRQGSQFGLMRFKASREWFSPRNHPPGTPLEATLEEIFVAAAPRSLFIACEGDRAVPFPSCTQTFAGDGLLFEVTMGKKHLSNWRQIETQTIDLMRTFAFENSKGGNHE